MALERGLEGRDQLLKLVKRHAREIQELRRAGLQLGEPYTSHGSCLLSLYCDVRGASYQKESGINSTLPNHQCHDKRLCKHVTSSEDPLLVRPHALMQAGWSGYTLSC